MDGQELLEPFTRLLADVATPEKVHAVEAGGSFDDMWQAFEESGFLDALVPESAGGAGLALGDVAPLLMALGAHAVPVPVAETMVARALLTSAGVSWPEGPIILVPKAAALPVQLATTARWALVEAASGIRLAEISSVEPTGVAGDLSGWLRTSEGGATLPPAPEGLLPVAAILRAAAIAGAADRLLSMTVAYANDRVQFGKPIGKQQALQQQLALMAELAVAARLAAQIGCASGLPPTLQAAATAKQVASAAAADIAAIAHAVHGAIGISAEYDLQLLTRRLHGWRLADGSESLWAAQLGKMHLRQPQSTLDFIRQVAA
jgi:alkylation response protein AidB-like acyl-CoA dehydrogenase